MKSGVFARLVGMAQRDSARRVRVLCVGNGGIVRRKLQLFAHRSDASFLKELAALVGEAVFVAWVDPGDDPLAQTPLDGVVGVRPVGLPWITGRLSKRLRNAFVSVLLLLRELYLADFVYIYWPGRIAFVTAFYCRVTAKPYGLYLRGERMHSQARFVYAFSKARFALTTGELLCRMAQAHCQDVENVTPMTNLRSSDILPPRRGPRATTWRFLYVGRIEEAKGVRDLVAAMVHLKEAGIAFELMLVGHCRDVSEFWRWVPAAVAGDINLTGAVADSETLRSYYYDADIFVLPSHDEGFPRVLYEAMTLGLPIVTTFVGSIDTVMRDGYNCLQIRVRDSRDIASKLRELISNNDLYAHLAEGGYQSIMAIMPTWKRSHAVQVAERLVPR